MRARDYYDEARRGAKDGVVAGRQGRWTLLAGVLAAALGTLGCGFTVGYPPPCFSLRVYVSDAATGLGLDFARVTVRSGVYESDVFILERDYAPDPLAQQSSPMLYVGYLPAGSYTVEVRADGYESQVVSAVRVPGWGGFGVAECAEVTVDLVPLGAGNASDGG